MKKRFLFVIVALVAVLSAGILFACGDGDLDGIPDTGAYAITVQKEGNGEVTVKNRADGGDDITITLAPAAGYTATDVKVNSKSVKIEDNTAKFIMPEQDVVVKVTFTENTYVAEVADSVGGTVVPDAESYKSGARVTLTVEPSYGYEFESLKVDGQTVTVTDGKYSFDMPAKNVSVEPKFNCAVDSKPLPENSQLTLSSAAPISGGVAKADIFVTFGDSAVTVKAYVEDNAPIEHSDGLRLYFGTTEYANGTVSANNLQVNALISEQPAVYGGEDDFSTARADIEGVTVVSEPWSKSEGVVCGYIMTVTVDYADLAITVDTTDELTVLPYLVNTDRRGSLVTVATVDDYYEYSNPDTYMTVSENRLNNNRYMFGKGAAGSYKNAVRQGNNWDVSKDYEQGDERYPQREIRLTGHDNADNNIAFFGSGGKTSFVKATFTVYAVHNDKDKAPKFGLMAFDTAARDSGVFFYVDALMTTEKTSGFGLGDITGDKLGYNTRRNAQWGNDWTTVESSAGAFDLETRSITLGMLYNNGLVYMYYYQGDVSTFAAAAAIRTTGEAVIGIKCFGLGLVVTDYEVTNDPNSELFKTNNKRVDGVTVGDNAAGYLYTDGWAIDEDVAENTGRGNQYVYVKDVLENKDLYAEVDVYAPGKCGNTSDPWTKVGMVLRNDKYMVFAYIDTADNTGDSRYGRAMFVVYYESSSGWGQFEQGTSYYKSDEITKDYVKLAIAKIDGDFYLYVNGEIAATYKDSSLRNEKFIAGVLGFNRHMYVKNGSGIVGAEQVKDKLGFVVPDDVNFDGVLDDAIWSDKAIENTLTFTGSSTSGSKLEVIAVKGETGVYVAVVMYTAAQAEAVASSTSYTSCPHVAMRPSSSAGTAALYVAFYNGFNGGVTSSVGVLGAAAKTERVEIAEDVNGYKTTVEFFIPYKQFGDGAAEEEKLPFYVTTYNLDKRFYSASKAYTGKNAFVTANGLILEDKA